MLIHRGEAWLDAAQAGISDGVSAGDVAGALGMHVHFDEIPNCRPQEILATAHAASFCLSLFNRLRQSGHIPRRVQTVAYVRHPSDGQPHAESEIFIDTEADIPGL